MNTVKTLATATLAFASISLLAQQPQNSDAPTAQQPPATQPMQQSAPPPTAAAPSAEMSPVNGELVDKLDSKTAKTGDSVVVKIKSTVKTSDGTEIPKGSKLVGKVMQAKASGVGNDNSQVALQFDHVELKSGQSMPIRAEIVGLSASDSAMNAAPDSTASSASAPSAGPAPAAGGGMNGAPSTSQGAATAQSSAPQNSAPGDATAASAGPTPAGPTPGTVVARTGNIAIRTTSIPGVLIATNEPGQQDPRMAQSSGILLGPKRDIHLDSGTRVVIGVASAGAASQGGGQ